MKYFLICKKIDAKSVPLRNEHGFVTLFDDELDANIERIYLQPDHDEILKVVETD